MQDKLKIRCRVSRSCFQLVLWMNEQKTTDRQIVSWKVLVDISFSLSDLKRYDKKQRTKRPSQRQGVKMLPSLRLQGNSLRLQGNLLWSTEVEYLKATKTETCGQLALHLPTLKQKKSWRSAKHKVTFPSPFLLVYSNFNEMHHPLIGLVLSWRRLPLLHVCIFVITNPREYHSNASKLRISTSSFPSVQLTCNLVPRPLWSLGTRLIYM